MENTNNKTNSNKAISILRSDIKNTAIINDAAKSNQFRLAFTLMKSAASILEFKIHNILFDLEYSHNSEHKVPNIVIGKTRNEINKEALIFQQSFLSDSKMNDAIIACNATTNSIPLNLYIWLLKEQSFGSTKDIKTNVLSAFADRYDSKKYSVWRDYSKDVHKRHLDLSTPLYRKTLSELKALNQDFRCKQCGSPLVFKTDAKCESPVYACPKHTSGKCRTKDIPAEDLNAAVVRAVIMHCLFKGDNQEFTKAIKSYRLRKYIDSLIPALRFYLGDSNLGYADFDKENIWFSGKYGTYGINVDRLPPLNVNISAYELQDKIIDRLVNDFVYNADEYDSAFISTCLRYVRVGKSDVEIKLYK